MPDRELHLYLGPLAAGAARIGTFAWDLPTGALAMDPDVVTLFGFDETTFDGTIGTIGSRVHTHDQARVARTFETALASGEPFDLEFRVVVPGRDARWVHARGRLVHGHDGLPARAIGVAFDSTTRQHGEAHTARLLEAMPTAFFSVDPDWRFTYLNHEAERLLGKDRADVVGRVLWEVFPDALDSPFEEHYRAAAATGRPVTFDAYYPAPLDTWYEARAWPGPDGLSVYFQDITPRRRAQELAERDARRTTILATVTSQLSETLDGEQAVARLAQLMVPDLAEWCIVTLVDADEGTGAPRGVQDLGVAHADPAARPLLERYAKLRRDAVRDSSPVTRALLGTTEVISVPSGAQALVRTELKPGEARELMELLAPDSATLLPVRGRDRTVGLITLFNSAERGPISPENLEIAKEVAERAGFALDNSRLYEQQRHLAEGLQRAMLSHPVEPDHLQIAVRYVPAAEAAQVGGDWYDAFMQRNGDTVLVIGDVVGHDSTAAATMGQLRSMLRGIAVATDAGPARLLCEVDRAMLTLRSEAIASAVVLRIEQSPDQLASGLRTIRWSNAGHPHPMVVHPDGRVVELAGADTNLLLGVDADAERAESVAELESGSTLFLYTDGLVERRDRSVAEGMARVRDALASAPTRELESLCDLVLTTLLGDRPEDDVAIVAVRLHRQDLPRPPQAGPEVVPENVPEDPAASC